MNTEQETAGPDTRERIRLAARELFAERGFRATTMRAIAAQASVDVALVAYYFGNKDKLFGAAVELPIEPAAVVQEIMRGPRESVGERFVLTLLSHTDDPSSGPATVALARSALTDTTGPNPFREFITTRMVSLYADAVGPVDGELRASLAASQVLGLLTARYIVQVEPLASLPHEEVATLIGPTIQHYLFGTL